MPGRDLVVSERFMVALDAVRSGTAVDPDARADPRGHRYRKAAMSPNTRRAYAFDISVYLRFCEIMGHREAPAHAMTLHNFMIYLAEMQPLTGKNKRAGMGLSPARLRRALAAVRKFHSLLGEVFPDTSAANEIIDGHENARSEPGTGVHDGEGVPPIKLPTLRELIRACPTDTNAGTRDRFMLGLGFAMMARRSELADADWAGVTVTDNGLRVKIAKAKNAPRGRAAIIIPWEDYPEEDPVAAYFAYRKHWRRAGVDVDSGPLFRAVDRWDHINGLGVWAGKAQELRMDPSGVEDVIDRAAKLAVAAGKDIPNAKKLRPHGLRSGGATSAYEGGADVLSIARQGGWGDHSPVVFRYIREVDMVLRNPFNDVVSGKARRQRAAV